MVEFLNRNQLTQNIRDFTVYKYEFFGRITPSYSLCILNVKNFTNDFF